MFKKLLSVEYLSHLSFIQDTRAAVSCSSVTARLGGIGFGIWLMGKLGRAWVGAWHVPLTNKMSFQPNTGKSGSRLRSHQQDFILNIAKLR